MTDTPELDKMLKVHGDSQIIGEFLEWARYNGYHFTKTQTVQAEGYSLTKDEAYEYDKDIEVPVSIERVLAEYFEIDLDKANAEREAAYAKLQAAARNNEKHRDTYTVHPPEEST